MRLQSELTMHLRFLQLPVVFFMLHTLLLSKASSYRLPPQQIPNQLNDTFKSFDQSPNLHLLARAESPNNSSGIVINDEPSVLDIKLDYDNAVSQGNNLLKLLATEDPSICGVQESNFSEWEALETNGWSKQYKSPPKYEQSWKLAAALLGLDGGDEQNIQYSYSQLINVTIDGKDYRRSKGAYNNVMNKNGTIFALQASSPRSRGKFEKPPVDGSPGNELVPLQSWADVAFIEWADSCNGDEKCIKGLRTVVKWHARNHATERVATEALGGKIGWGPWPGKSFSNGSKELAATLATPSGRGVAWLLLTHRNQLGWKYVDAVDLWSEEEGDFEKNFFAFHIKDQSEGQPPKSRLARSTLESPGPSDSILHSTNKGLIPRADPWEAVVSKGKEFISMLECSSAPASEFKSYDNLADWGWKVRSDPVSPKLLDDAWKKAIEYVGAQVGDEGMWQVIDMHSETSEHDGATYPPTGAFYENRYTPEVIISTNNWSPRSNAGDENSPSEVFPKLERLSDVLFLEYQRLMDKFGKPQTGLRGILKDMVINEETQNIAIRALALKPNEPLSWPEWPGQDFEAGSDEFAALIASPNGRAAVWLLATHREQLGHKTISSVRAFGKRNSLDLFFKFEDVDGSSGDDEDPGASQDTGDHAVASPGIQKKPIAIAKRGDGDPLSLQVPQPNEPGDFMSDEDWRPWVEKGKAYLDILSCGKGTESKWASYDDLKRYGWVRRSENHPLKIYEKGGLANVMKYLEVPSKGDDQWQVADHHLEETTVDGKTYYPTNARYNNKYNMELITSDFNFGPRNKGQYADPPVTGDPNPFPPLEHYSDVVYLEFVRLMTMNNKPIDRLKGVLRSHVVSFETREIVEKAVGVLKDDMVQDKLPWPGKDFGADSDELAALVASPNGRGVAWLLATHKELGRKTISSARVFYDNGIYVLFVFKDLEGETGDADSSTGTAQARRDLVHHPTRNILEPRALSQEKYDELLEKGKKLVKALGSNQDCFPQSEFTDYQDLKKWGWSRKVDTKVSPTSFGPFPYVFKHVEASDDAKVNRWVVDSHDQKVTRDGKVYYPTKASYGNKYNPKIITSLANFGPANRGKTEKPPVTGDPNPFPLLARQSDVLFLEYQRLMTEMSQPLDQLKALWRHGIVNEYTRELCIKLAAKEDGFAPHHIPEWPGKDFDAGSDELAALVGAPNGVAVAYLLLQHREQMGRKHITGVRVWYDWQLHILFSIGDIPGNTGESSSHSRRDSAHIKGLLKPFYDNNSTQLSSRALDEADFRKFVEKGKPLVVALQSSDQCMTQSGWTEDESLGIWGWYRMRKPKVGPVSHFTATKQVYDYVGASMEQDSNHRAYDSHSDKKNIDGVTYYQTGAEFDNRYNPAIIIAENIYGVEHEGKNQKPPVTGDPHPFPKLRFWSDVTFLEYKKFMMDTEESLDQLKAVWHRVIINPKTRSLAARLFDVAEWTDVPDWPGKDFEPGSDEFNALIGSDNGKGVVFLLLQHREQLGKKTITKARVWKDHTLHILYIFDGTCAGEDDPSSTHDNRLARRIEEPESELLKSTRDHGRYLEMAQSSTVNIMKSCLGIEQSKFSALEDLKKSGWILLQNTKEAVEEDKDPAIFNAWLDLNLDRSADSNHKIEYQHLEKTTGSDGRVYYPSGAYYRSLVSEGAIAALDSRSPWSAGRERNPRVDGLANAFPPLKQWSEETFLVYKDVCEGNPEKMANLKGVLRHSITNTETKKALREYMDRIGDLEDGKPREWPGTLFKLDDDGFHVALGVPNGKGVAYLLATNREALGWKEIYQIRIFGASWQSPWNALYYIRDHKDDPQRRSLNSLPLPASSSGAIALRISTGLGFDQSLKDKQVATYAPTLGTVAGGETKSLRPRALNEDLYQRYAQRGSILLCYAHNILLDHAQYHQSTWTNFEDLPRYGWSELESAQSSRITLEFNDLDEPFEALDLSMDRASNVRHAFPHNQDSRVQDEFYPRTHGNYEYIFNVEGGAIAAVSSHNPSAMRKASELRPGERLTALRQWSDITFLAWQKYAGERVRNLRYVFQCNIANEDTLAVIKYIMESRRQNLKEWPGLHIPMTDPDAEALLGTPNGRGVAWLLIQHKEQLGLKVPDAVTIYGVEDGIIYSLCFWITEKADVNFELDTAGDAFVPPQKRSANGTVIASRPPNTAATSDRAFDGVVHWSAPLDVTAVWPKRFCRRLNKAIKVFWASLWLV